jgi:hypothetical protein
MKAIIQSGGYQVRQTYQVQVPVDVDWTTYQSKTIHEDGTSTISVIDHGVMVREGYNQTFSKSGALRIGLYKFQVSNADGAFDRGAVLWKHTTSNYQAEPSECKVTRFISVAAIGSASFTMIPGTYYLGKINRVEYTLLNIGVPKSAALFCEPSELVNLTGYNWGVDDYDNIRMGTGTISGPEEGDN